MAQKENAKENTRASDPGRCSWAGNDPLYVSYHDQEWGVPVRDDRKLFEFIVLESFQAGLSWITILRKRENFRRAFLKFDPIKVATMGEKDVARLMEDAGIVRNQAKIRAAINNAQRFLEVQDSCGSFSNYSWDFVDGHPIVNRWKDMKAVPATTPLSDRMSRDLKQRGFKFVGSTVIYAHMQAVGMVNDHTLRCFRYKEVQGL